jgi:hypothetical protein
MIIVCTLTASITSGENPCMDAVLRYNRGPINHDHDGGAGGLISVMTVTGAELVGAFDCISIARRHLKPDISKEAKYQHNGSRSYELALPVTPAANCPLIGVASLPSTKAEETT